jgi:hypothetical protein
MVLHPEILHATGAERDRSRRPAHPAPADRRRGRAARPRRAGGAAGAAADTIRAAVTTALLGRGRTGTR